ncbi:uncharacterized protein YndB with AHSA1/START domain [Ulvibacter sp. MAR_2010_11]|uniref:SRPBCC domain-containing protein n=1 Tax=Ulvibacter sp. MAR_2010_11 TaxID=1250229 RepID=UPI000C2C701D|nr:SRPBCC domain-containing protein [Ulvibacter sp. MAR_2010_11]PKA83728.1 uncharacterized protein YndB with AHSA1/START domain [Ulvibacter sp. MAR_2010_11]
MKLDVKVKNTIQRSVEEVFEAIVNPEKLTGYFVSATNARITEGAKIKWEFADYNVTVNVDVKEVVLNRKIVFDWSASGVKAEVTLSFHSETTSKTTLEITERTFEFSEEGVAKAMQQTQGWTDFICSLKAYLYTGINLRSGKYN